MNSGDEFSCRDSAGCRAVRGLLVYTAIPGSDSHEKLQLLSVIGAQTLH